MILKKQQLLLVILFYVEIIRDSYMASKKCQQNIAKVKDKFRKGRVVT